MRWLIWGRLGMNWVGGLICGDRGVAAFKAVLVCLPLDFGGSKELLLDTCVVPLVLDWVLAQVVTGSCFFPFLRPSILRWKEYLEMRKER